MNNINKDVISFPLNLVSYIPVESPSKLVALNALACLSGLTFTLSPLPFAAKVALLGVMHSEIYSGLADLKKVEINKAMHACLVVFSFHTALLSTESVLAAIEMSRLFSKFDPYSAYMGFHSLGYLTGLAWPMTGIVISLGNQTLSTVRNKEFMTNPDMLAKVIEAVKVYGIICERFLPRFFRRPLDTEETYRVILNNLINNYTQEEFNQFFLSRRFSDWSSLPDIFKENKERYKEFYTSIIKPTTKNILLFRKSIESRLAEAQTKEAVEALEADFSHYTNRVEKFLKILEVAPQVDEGQPRLVESLKECYSKYLTYTGLNEYRHQLNQLSEKYDPQSEEDDLIYEIIPDIFSEGDCRGYLERLNLKKGPGKTAIGVFMEELTRLKLETRGRLRKVDFFPVPGSVKERKEKLMATVEKVKGIKHWPMLTQLKGLFFTACVYTAKAGSLIYHPWHFLAGVVAGLIFWRRIPTPQPTNLEISVQGWGRRLFYNSISISAGIDTVLN